jgi:hypothetical protein
MSNRTIVPHAIRPTPINVETLSARPPVLSTEDPQAYSALYRKFRDMLRPADVFEYIWIHDIVHLTWEIQRLRCLSADFMSRSAHGRGGSPGGLSGEDPMEKAIIDWGKAAQEGAEATGTRIPDFSLPADPVPTTPTPGDLAAGFIGNIESYERTDKLLASAELRRNALLHEIDQRRASFANRVRTATDEIIEAEYAAHRPHAEHDAAGGGR